VLGVVAIGLLCLPQSFTFAATPASGWERSDKQTYDAIRQEGLQHSQAMRYAGELSDGIGARLMGSPNMRKAYDWAAATMKGLGMSNVHLEDIGEFGLSWRQNNTWMRMSSPDSMQFEAQAAPWSVSTAGPVEGTLVPVVIADEAAMAKYRGKLSGKVVLLGPLREVPEPFKPFAERYTDEQLADGSAVAPIQHYYASRAVHLAAMSRSRAFKIKVGSFLAQEHVLAVAIPSRDGENGGGTGDLSVDDSAIPGQKAWRPAARPTFPVVYVSIESFGRAWRLASANVVVTVQLQVDTQVLNEHEHGYNIVGDLPGQDPALANQLVVLGAHLDSWGAGTGATDDGAGVAVTLESIRILQSLHIKPRRTIRVVLYGGEEEGLFGSIAYVTQHLGSVPRSTEPDQLLIPVEGWRKKVGPLQLRSEYPLLSAAYNLDDGAGRIRGVFAGGNPVLADIYRDWITPLKDLGVSTIIDGLDWPADESSFSEIGLPGVSYLQDPLDYDSRSHHTNMDTMERLPAGDMAQASVVSAIFAINTADCRELLPRPSKP